MNKLPFKFLPNVFINLHLCGKKECMLVCHRWANVIRSTVLFDTAHINKEYTFAKFRRYLDSQPSNKAQIQNLIIYSFLCNQEALKYFQEYFPNLRLLYIQRYTHDFLYYYNRQQIDTMAWISKIAVLEQYNSLHYHPNFLSLGKYRALKRLIHCYTIHLGSLANVPNITSLTLKRILISTSELETIHSHLLALTSLELENITMKNLNFHQALNQAPITPSILVTRLFITSHHSDANSATFILQNWLTYIRYKYTHLLELRFLINSSQPVKMETERILVSDGILSLLEDIGNKIKLLEIDCSTSLPLLLECMNSLGFQERCLNLSLSYSTSKKSLSCLHDTHNFIRELTLNINRTIWIRRLLVNVRSLKVLTIKGMLNFIYSGSWGQTVILLEDIFTLCSNSLDSLRIEAFHVDSMSSVHQLYSLTKLEIHNCHISLAAYGFISRQLPNLRYLTLDYCQTVKDTIQLNSLNLYRLDLYVLSNTYIKIKTDDNDRTSKRLDL